jgi:tetratricopeptide (TPR) repeat protein
MFVLLLAAVALGAPRLAHGQAIGDIESLVARGRYTDARAALGNWLARHPRNQVGTPDEHARALMLSGRLAASPAAALDAYLAVALGYPTSDHAPVALLRLGQGLLATGEVERAMGYLERLVRDYPNASDRIDAMIWLARAQRAAGGDASACATVRDAATLRTDDAEARALLRHEEALACSDE